MPRSDRLARTRAPALLLAALLPAATGALVLAGTVPATARAADEAAAAAPTERPSRGMTKAQVEARYGAPASRQEAVGQPPISRWDYPGMIIYFEYDHVVHAVLTSGA